LWQATITTAPGRRANSRHLHDKDREYFRRSREERVDMTLEDLVAERDARLPAFRQSLAPLRLTLKAQPFLGGDRPLYADYAVFGPFQWARCISPFALLAPDDPITLWRERCEWALPVSATYVIDGHGVIIYSDTGVDYRDRANPRDILEMLKQQQAAAE
jgi:glutathione S-transferase